MGLWVNSFWSAQRITRWIAIILRVSHPVFRYFGGTQVEPTPLLTGNTRTTMGRQPEGIPRNPPFHSVLNHHVSQCRKPTEKPSPILPWWRRSCPSILPSHRSSRHVSTCFPMKMSPPQGHRNALAPELGSKFSASACRVFC